MAYKKNYLLISECVPEGHCSLKEFSSNKGAGRCHLPPLPPPQHKYTANCRNWHGTNIHYLTCFHQALCPSLLPHSFHSLQICPFQPWLPQSQPCGILPLRRLAHLIKIVHPAHACFADLPWPVLVLVEWQQQDSFHKQVSMHIVQTVPHPCYPVSAVAGVVHSHLLACKPCGNHSTHSPSICFWSEPIQTELQT